MSSMERSEPSANPQPSQWPHQQQPTPGSTTAAGDSGGRAPERAGGASASGGGSASSSGGGGNSGGGYNPGGNSGGGNSGAASRQGSAQATGGRGGGADRGRSSPVGAVLAALALGLILGGLATAFYLQSADDGGDPFAGQVDPARYQAVILSNDKVYFGQIDSVSDDFFRLRRAFFLRETTGTSGGEPVRALLPVNREIHAPDNTLLIRKADVILVENLAKDSPILTEIRRQVGNGK